MADNKRDPDWHEKFTRLSKERRVKVIARAASMITNPDANENEKVASLKQFQVALEVDPDLTLEVIASIRGNGLTDDDVEKLKQEAVEARTNFEGLAQSIVKFREVLVEVGMIGITNDIPRTAEQWRQSVGDVVARQARQLEIQKVFLRQQRQELEAMREEIRAEIMAAQNTQRQPTFLGKLMGVVSHPPMMGHIEKLNAISLDYEQIQAPKTGELVQGEGIFTRLWTPKYANGKPLGFEVELYTAPEDLRYAPNVGKLQTYLNSVESVANLRNWHGHDGGNFANDKEVRTFLAKAVRSYAKVNPEIVSSGAWFRLDDIGKWFLPFGEHVDGKIEDKNGNRVKVCDENHFDLKNTGDFAGTFTTSSSSDLAHWYWSSTEHRDDSDYVWNVNFSNGNADYTNKALYRESARPVRVGRVRYLTI